MLSHFLFTLSADHTFFSVRGRVTLNTERASGVLDFRAAKVGEALEAAPHSAARLRKEAAQAEKTGSRLSPWCHRTQHGRRRQVGVRAWAMRLGSNSEKMWREGGVLQIQGLPPPHKVYSSQWEKTESPRRN